MKIADIQYITRDNKTLSHAQQAKLMFENGIQWVQIRIKNAPYKFVSEQVKEALEYAHEFNCTLIVNDSVDLVKETGAHGIHVGLKDMPINKVRAILGNNAIIGGTANTLEDIQHQVRLGADYIGLGPFRFTTTKEKLSPILGIEGYRKIANELRALDIDIPIVGVGGITPDDIPQIKNTGLHGVAISGALLKKYTEQ